MSTANKPKKDVVQEANDPSVPQYRVTGARHYINGRRYDVGSTVFYSGKPGSGLVPLNDAAKKAAAKPESKPAAQKAADKSGEF